MYVCMYRAHHLSTGGLFCRVGVCDCVCVRGLERSWCANAGLEVVVWWLEGGVEGDSDDVFYTFGKLCRGCGLNSR